MFFVPFVVKRRATFCVAAFNKETHLSDNAGDIAQRILEQARKKADAAEVLYDEAESAGVRFQDNQLKSVSGSSSSGVGLRVIHRGRLGFSCTNDFDSVRPRAQGRAA